MKKIYPLWPLTFLAVLLAVTFAEAPTAMAAGKRLILPHTKPDAIAHPSFISPDGRYIATIIVSEGEAGKVSVSKRHRAKRKPLARFWNADDFVWVPRHPHLLVVATGGADYGEGMIAAWTHGKRFRYLRRASNPDGEGYIIKGVAMNGRSLVYKHYLDEADYGATHILRLP